MLLKAIAIALVTVPLFSSSAIAETCSRTYEVKEGDYCDEISAANNVSTYQLATVNNGIDDLCGNLAIGWNLCLGFTDADCTETYAVQPDDTIEDIASAHGFNSSILLANNPQLENDSSNLYIGEVLAVCGNVTVPAATNTSTSSSVPANAQTANEVEWCD